MRLAFTILLIFSCCLLSFAQSGNIEFSKVLYDFGEITEKGGVVQYDFIFKNIGDLPVHISGVKANCGCTIPVWTRSEVAPGEYGFVKVKYNPEGRPGYFVKSLVVSATDGQNRFNRYLNIKGKSVAEKAALTPAPGEDSNDNFFIHPYVQYYKWGRKYMDTLSPGYTALVRDIAAVASRDGFVNIKLESSASRVPSALRVSDREFAQIRAGRAKATLLRTLRQKGIHPYQVGFLPSDILVQGPAYSGKRSDLPKYERYQYVKIFSPDYLPDSAQIEDDFLKDSEISLTVQVMPDDIKRLESLDTLSRDTSLLAEERDGMQGRLELQIYDLKRQIFRLRMSDSLSHMELALLQDSVSVLNNVIEQLAGESHQMQDTAWITRMMDLEDELHVRYMYDSLLQMKVQLLMKENELRKQSERSAKMHIAILLHRVDSLNNELDRQTILADQREVQQSAEVHRFALDNLSEIIRVKEERIKRLDREGMKLIAEKDSAIKSGERIDERMATLQLAADSVLQERARLESELDTTRQQFSEANALTTSLEGINKQLQEKLAESRRTDSLLQSKIKMLQNRVEEKERENLVVQAEMDKLSAQLDEMQLAGQQVRAEAELATRDVDSMRQTVLRERELHLAALDRVEELEQLLQKEREEKRNALAFANEMKQQVEQEIAEKEKLRDELAGMAPAEHGRIAGSGKQQLIYRVQVAISEKAIPLSSRKFKGYSDVHEEYISGKYKYTIGGEQDMRNAMMLKDELREKGFEFAFVVAYLNDERISMQEARRISAQ